MMKWVLEGMDPKEKKRKWTKRYKRRDKIRRKYEHRSGEKIERIEGWGIKPKIKRKETILRGYAGDNSRLERSTKGERFSKRHRVMIRVSSEDIKSSRSMIKEYEVIPLWMIIYLVTSEEDDVLSNNASIAEYGDGPLWEGEEALSIMNGIPRL